MSRAIGPSCKLCRREGRELFLKGDRCFSSKCGIKRRAYAPGQHGQSRSKLSTYGLQLREKQKAKRFYGILERQFKRYFSMAIRMKGMTGTILVQILERRLDNVVYRSGFAVSRKMARQLVRHGHIKVNGKRVDIPSYLVDVQDAIELDGASKEVIPIKLSMESTASRGFPAWLEVDPQNLKSVFKYIPERDEINLPFQEQMVVELYSK